MKVTAEELKRKAAERRQRAEARAKYEEMLTVPHKTGKRLLKAFPQLKSKEHDVLVSDLRNRLKKIKNRYRILPQADAPAIFL